MLKTLFFVQNSVMAYWGWTERILYFLRKCIKHFIKRQYIHMHLVIILLSLSLSQFQTASSWWSSSCELLSTLQIYWQPLKIFTRTLPLPKGRLAHNPPAPLLDHLSNPRALYLSSLSLWPLLPIPLLSSERVVV